MHHDGETEGEARPSEDQLELLRAEFLRLMQERFLAGFVFFRLFSCLFITRRFGSRAARQSMKQSCHWLSCVVPVFLFFLTPLARARRGF